jgi:predicted RNase H-like HicB family nuclease
MNALVDKIISGHDLTFNLEFQRDEESGWLVVHVVELPGCVSQGATIDEAKANIANALESYMEVLLETAIRNQAAHGTSPSVKGERDRKNARASQVRDSRLAPCPSPTCRLRADKSIMPSLRFAARLRPWRQSRPGLHDFAPRLV